MVGDLRGAHHRHQFGRSGTNSLRPALLRLGLDMRGDLVERAGQRIPECGRAVLLGQRAGVEAVCELCELFDRLVRVGGEHFHQRECGFGDG